MKVATKDIIKQLTAQLTFTEKILDCTVVANGVELELCETHGIVDKSIVIIGGNEVNVIDILPDNKILIPGTTCPVETELTIPAPNFYNGTIKAVSAELTMVKDLRKRHQIVYLYEVLKEKRNRDPEKNVGRYVDIIMFFLTASTEKVDLTEQRYTEYMDPMCNLCEDFVDLLETSPLIGEIEDEEYEITPHSIAGFYDRLGHVKNFFNEQYSGCEFRMRIPIEAEACKDCVNN